MNGDSKLICTAHVPEVDVPAMVAETFGLGREHAAIIKQVLPPNLHVEFGPGLGQGMIRYNNGTRISVEFLIDLYNRVGLDHTRNAVFMAGLSYFPVKIIHTYDQEKHTIDLRVLE